MKFISSCQIQAEISSNRHIFQNFQISKAWALKNPGSGPLNKISPPGHEKARNMPCSLKVSTLAKDDIEASSWKRGSISCPAWKSKFHAGHEIGWYRGYCTETRCISCPAWKSKCHAGHEIGRNLNFMPGMKISIWLISCLAGHEFRSQPISCGAWNLFLALFAVENLDVFCWYVH